MTTYRALILGTATLGAAALTPAAFAQGQVTQVTTYVVKVQEERESTRWTLTEWLRIKERMRMMDVWLAMFSDPKKDKFQPELMLSYGVTRGKYSYDSGDARVDEGSLNGTAGRAQLWLTNLVSSTIGIRTLNVDLGAEFYRRQTGDFSSSGAPASAAAAATVDPASGTSDAAGTATPAAATASTDTGGTTTRQLRTEYYTGNLRIFGRNVQDSSLALKYGRYTAVNDIIDSSAGGDESTTMSGIASGAELQLYVFRWLGAEGNYMRYGDARGADGSAALRGSYYDYMGYVEISLLRLMGGVYHEEWELTRGVAPYRTTETGTIGGVKLQF